MVSTGIVHHIAVLHSSKKEECTAEYEHCILQLFTFDLAPYVYFGGLLAFPKQESYCYLYLQSVSSSALTSSESPSCPPWFSFSLSGFSSSDSSVRGTFLSDRTESIPYKEKLYRCVRQVYLHCFKFVNVSLKFYVSFYSPKSGRPIHDEWNRKL